jgi:transposase
MLKVADTMLRHIEGIVNSALTDITNSIAEGINSQIQVVKTVARGFANVEGYRNAILFFQGKLKLFPL